MDIYMYNRTNPSKLGLCWPFRKREHNANMRDMESKELEQDRPISTGDQHEEEISDVTCFFMFIMVCCCCVVSTPFIVYMFVDICVELFSDLPNPF